jgi:hypothetical protein
MSACVETTRVYLDAHGHGVIRCRACGSKRAMPRGQLTPPLGGKGGKVTCHPCGNVFYVRFDCRHQPRHTVYLPAKLFHSYPGGELGPLTVISLSAGGLGFFTKGPLSVHQGERYAVVFFLYNRQLSLIVGDIVVKRLQGQAGGATFAARALSWYDFDLYLAREQHRSHEHPAGKL